MQTKNKLGLLRFVDYSKTDHGSPGVGFRVIFMTAQA